MSPDAVGGLLRSAVVPWWLAGGWALDAHVGRQTRPHADTDVAVLRPDLPRLRLCLAEWDLHAADPPGTLRPWPADEELPVGVHDVWCRPGPGEPWQLQLMIEEVDGASRTDWVYRHDARIRRPSATLAGPASTAALPVLAPEVQLLYKSRAPRPKDHADLDACRPSLTPAQRAWLVHAPGVTSPGHAWVVQLAR